MYDYGGTVLKLMRAYQGAPFSDVVARGTSHC